jgi:8-oxo-dGTP pyrophosphatase MutT (NUDIX family)
MTLGVRGLLIKDERVLLVEHTYVPGWQLPGGGVDATESVGDALVREIREETGAVLTGRALLFGIYRNAKAHKRDHVALYVCRDWERPAGPRPSSFEIAAVELFPLAELPNGTTPATLARIREVLAGEQPSTDW